MSPVGASLCRTETVEMDLFYAAPEPSLFRNKLEKPFTIDELEMKNEGEHSYQRLLLIENKGEAPITA